MVIQVAQPQVCYANLSQDATDKNSSLCRRVSEVAKNHLGVDITGISLFDAIGQLRPSAASASNLSCQRWNRNSHRPPKSSNHQLYLNLSAP